MHIMLDIIKILILMVVIFCIVLILAKIFQGTFSRKGNIIILVVIILVLSYGYIKGNQHYFQSVAAFKDEVRSKGQEILKMRLYDLQFTKKEELKEDEREELSILQSLDIDKVKGEVFNINKKFSNEYFNIKIMDAIYVDSLNELHLGITYKKHDKLYPLSLVLEDDKEKMNYKRSLYTVSGIFNTFEKCWFKNIDLHNTNELYLLITPDHQKNKEKEIRILIYKGL